MKVELIGITKPTACSDVSTAEELVAYCARVSNPDNQANKKTVAGLVRYLIKHEHWSPFEMVSLTMGITTTRDISRQIIRHRSFSFQEFSQRYAVPNGWTTREARKQDLNNRQNSIELEEGSRLDEDFAIRQQNVWKKAHDTYEWAINQGIAKEQARAVLPEGLTNTTLYMSGTLRSWLHYCDLRATHGTQKEHSEIAIKAFEILGQHFPNIVGAFENTPTPAAAALKAV